MEQNQVNSKKNIFKKRLLWFVVIVFIVVTFANCSDSGNNVTKETASTTTQPASQAQPKDLVFGLNEAAVFPKLKVTATDVKISSGDSFFKPESGNSYYGVQFQIENSSNEVQHLSSLLLFDSYVDRTKASLSLFGGSDFSDGTLDGELEPGRQMKGWVVVEAASGAKEIEMVMKDNWLSGNKAKFILNL